MTMDFSAQRLSYEQGELLEDQIPTTPKALLQSWLQHAIDKKVIEPYAMSLATCGQDLQPSVRTVLLRAVSDSANNQAATQTDSDFGLIFYTNYDSEKGQDIAENPHAQALFFWHALERQVRITGKVRKVSKQQSSDYFHKRPHDSQVAAWVSEPQSGVVTSRAVMDAKFAQLHAAYLDGSIVPKPDFWGGYELVAEAVEFWQGRANRMHDRIVYRKTANMWKIERLLP